MDIQLRKFRIEQGYPVIVLKKQHAISPITRQPLRLVEALLGHIQTEVSI